MREAVCALAILALAISGVGVGLGDAARGDTANLAGGVLIAHHPAGMVYSSETPPEGWCGKYLNEFAITSAEEQVNRTDAVGDRVFWFVLSARRVPDPAAGRVRHGRRADGECQLLLENDCTLAGGVFHTEWDSCTPNPCQDTPAVPDSWGGVKNLYR